MTLTRPAIDVRIHDTQIGIWQDNARDETFRTEVFGPLIKAMKSRGWIVRADPNIMKHHWCLSPSHRIASRGNLRAGIRISGRVVEIDYWAETWPLDNCNGRRHDFHKLARMEYLDRLRFRLEVARITSWLQSIAPVTIKEDEPAGLTALERIQRRYAECWHTDKTLGRPVSQYSYNHTSRDGQKIEHGATVWFVGRDGRIGRGTAYYNLNSMWWVVCGKDGLSNLSTCEIFCKQPSDLRTKRNERQRRARLEGELASAVRCMDFRRAETLKNILFGSAPTFLIWAKDHGAYYRANYCGYTTDTIAAGRYTRAEAEAEVRRVPHELEAIGPDGERIKFARAA
ncbi:hypothetical protein [Mesorhizobium sp.]|uniref:hypothetical protein n=1 Tax=Mesorhizobium sp. TaxID=1871066 RepID=UPI00121593CA|nr:hypothetical protein [Mesorhizobium sp.]TIL29986.1 MAG: hypothetical protein E5Y85_25480 [Mesorhizobium sp.]